MHGGTGKPITVPLDNGSHVIFHFALSPSGNSSLDLGFIPSLGFKMMESSEPDSLARQGKGFLKYFSRWKSFAFSSKTGEAGNGKRQSERNTNK